MDQLGRVIKIIIQSIAGGMQVGEYIFNEENINDITAFLQQQKRYVRVYITMHISAQETADKLYTSEGHTHHPD